MNFKGNQNVISNCVILFKTASKLIRKGCATYLAYLIDSKKARVKLNNLLIMREFQDMFPE